MYTPCTVDAQQVSSLQLPAPAIDGGVNPVKENRPVPLATLEQIEPPADAIRCHPWEDDGQRGLVITEQVDLDAAGHALHVNVAGAQDYTGAVERRVVLEVGGDCCELTANQVDGLVAALLAAKELL